MTTKKGWNPKKHKKIFFIAITVFAVLIIASIIVIISQQKEKTFIENPKIDNPYIYYEDESEYCNMSFRTKEEAELCKKIVEKTWHPQYINCMPWSSEQLCGKARKAGYPYIAE